MKPYLSVVVVTRNDNYGSDLLGRLRTFHRVLVELCTEAKLQTEIVLVEWNPPPDRPGMADVARSLTRSAFVGTRVITVPAAVHSALPLASRRSLFEYVGKNAGIRRCRGEYILVTNPDTVFSKQLVGKFTKGRLREDTFYRVNRTDVVSPIPEEMSACQVEDYCRRNVLRTQSHWIGDRHHNQSLQDWVRHAPAILRHSLTSLVRYRMLVPPHFGAPGDFMLMHSRHWNRMGGFPEIELFTDRSYHLDSLGVIGARHLGLRQEVFGDACALYHQEHEYVEKEKPWTPATRFAFDAMRALHRPWPNSDQWGLGEHQLPEQTMRDTEAVEPAESLCAAR